MRRTEQASSGEGRRGGRAGGAGRRAGQGQGQGQAGGEGDAHSDAGFLSDRRFSNANVRARLSSASLDAMRDVFGHDRLSKVQALTLEPLLAGEDLFVKSKTGSGKTMAFLLPLVERTYAALAAAPLPGGNRAGGMAPIMGIVVSPTKELAAQTFGEARRLLPETATLRVALFVGGSSKGADLAQLRQRVRRGEGLLLVATPGRLQDHIDTTPGFRQATSVDVRTVVLDEADRMLDAGFRRPLEAILDATPKTRQTVLVSATMPAEVLRLAHKYMRVGWRTLDATGGDGGEQAGDDPGPRVAPGVEHRAVAVLHEMQLPTLLRTLRQHARDRPEGFKVVVFFPFVKQVALMAALLRRLVPGALGGGTQTLEIHGKMEQKDRTRASEAFRRSGRAVLAASDVIARGVDYPDVTLVVQMGMTDRETYVHRVGRTGRAGNVGQGAMILAAFEEAAMRRELEGLGVRWIELSQVLAARQTGAPPPHSPPPPPPPSPGPRANATNATNATNVSSSSAAAEVEGAVRGLMAEREKLFEVARVAWVGTYAARAGQLKMSKAQVEQEAVKAYAALGYTKPLSIDPKLRKKMGLAPGK